MRKDAGSSLFRDWPGANLSVHAGGLGGATGLSLAGHIYPADRERQFGVADGLPCFCGDDTTMTAQVT